MRGSYMDINVSRHTQGCHLQAFLTTYRLWTSPGFVCITSHASPSIFIVPTFQSRCDIHSGKSPECSVSKIDIPFWRRIYSQGSIDIPFGALSPSHVPSLPASRSRCPLPLNLTIFVVRLFGEAREDDRCFRSAEYPQASTGRHCHDRKWRSETQDSCRCCVFESCKSSPWPLNS